MIRDHVQTVTVTTRVLSGHDPSGGELWDTATEHVDGVLVAPGSQSNMTESMRPEGVTVAATMYFPRTYPMTAHRLRGATIETGYGKYEVVGDPFPYEGDTPTGYNMVVEVTRSDG